MTSCQIKSCYIIKDHISFTKKHFPNADISENLPSFVAEWNGTVKGFAYARLYRNRPSYRFTLEDTIYLDPHIIGKGAGSKLLSKLIHRCSQLGYRQMIAVIQDSSNIASIGLHKRLGFKISAIIPSIAFKHNRWVKTLIMQRSLKNSFYKDAEQL